MLFVNLKVKYSLAHVHKKQMDTSTKTEAKMKKEKTFLETMSKFIYWIPLSPTEIYVRHKEMYNWADKAEEYYLQLEKSAIEFDKNRKKKIDELLKTLLRKTSATEACRVLYQISNLLKLSDLLNFATQQKFSGLLGINQVVNMTLSGVYFHSGVHKDITTILGGIFIDYGRRCKLGSMLEEHDELQNKIYELSSDSERARVKKTIERISATSRERRYNLRNLLMCGEEIRKILGTLCNPIELGLHWTNLGVDPKGKNFDFYPMARDKEDGGYFQYLCIVLFSLNFNS